MMRRLFLALATLAAAALAGQPALAEPSHAIAMHGDPALEPGEWDFRDGERAAKVMEKIYG